MKSILPFLTDLIKFRSVNGHNNEIKDCVRYIESYLKSASIHYERFYNNDVPSLLIMPEKRKSKILLMSHIDVVEGEDHQFKPYEKDGYLYGRGSIDDKYAVALSLVLFKTMIGELRAAGKSQKDMPFGILITGDEESGGINGAKYVLGLISTDFAIALDGGSVEKIIVHEKGLCHIKLTASGVSAHGARPWLGINAIEILIEDLSNIKNLFQEDSDDHWHKTLNIGKIKAGNAVNQVPDVAEAWVDIRYTENDDIEGIIGSIRKISKSHLDVNFCDPVFISGESEHLDRLMKTAEDTILENEHGASDARFLSEYNIPGIVWGANGDMTQHSSQEKINIESLEKLYKIIEKFIMSYL